ASKSGAVSLIASAITNLRRTVTIGGNAARYIGNRRIAIQAAPAPAQPEGQARTCHRENSVAAFGRPARGVPRREPRRTRLTRTDPINFPVLPQLCHGCAAALSRSKAIIFMKRILGLIRLNRTDVSTD